MSGYRDPDDLEPVTPAQRELLIRMDLARRIRPYVIGDAEKIAEKVAAELVADLEAIGFVLEISWDRSVERDPET